MRVYLLTLLIWPSLAWTSTKIRRRSITDIHFERTVHHPTVRLPSDLRMMNSDRSAVDDSFQNQKKKYVVVGAGWAGWGAVKALCESGQDVTLVDALSDPTGRTPYFSKSGKPVEAGTKGFWKDYPNINRLCQELGLDENQVFTEFTNSSLYSPNGFEVTAPVFAKNEFPRNNLPFLSQLSGETLPNQLPSPIGQIVLSFPYFERVPLSDRVSLAGLLAAAVDCLGSDEKVQQQYDRMTAHELFLRFGLSQGLCEDFFRPFLLVTLFKAPEEVSALVTLELLYFFALAHVDSFDVRWIRNGTVADSLIAPLATKLQTNYGLRVLGGCRVGCIYLNETAVPGEYSVTSVEYCREGGVKESIDDVDGLILALSSKGMKSVVSKSPDLARLRVFSQAASLKGIDVMSVRIWLDRTVPTRSPSNVFARFDALRGAGGTFFMLDQLQAESVDALWGDDEVQGSVVACDFYNAGALLTLSDDELIRIITEDLLSAAVPAFYEAVVVDSWVGRYPGAVSWFSPGSYEKRPPLQGAGKSLRNLKCAGDWVRMEDREHGSKGLCQERAFVSGLEAANALLRDTTSKSIREHTVLPVREDEPLFKLGVALNQQVMRNLPRWWIR